MPLITNIWSRVVDKQRNRNFYFLPFKIHQSDGESFFLRKFDQCRLHYTLRISVLRRYKRIEANGKNSYNNVLIILHFFSVLSERIKFLLLKRIFEFDTVIGFQSRTQRYNEIRRRKRKFFEGFIGFEWDQSERIFIDVHE